MAFVGRNHRAPTHVERFRTIVAKHFVVLAQPPHWIEHDAKRARSGHMTRRELRIIGGYRSGADHDGVRQGAHPVQVDDIFLSGDELRIAGVRGDETIDALTKMTDRDWMLLQGAADGKLEVQTRGPLVLWRQE